MSFLFTGDFTFPFEAVQYIQETLYIWSGYTGALNLDGIIRFSSRLPVFIVFSLFGNLAASYFYLTLALGVLWLSQYIFYRSFLDVPHRVVAAGIALAGTMNPVILGYLAKVGLVLAVAMLPLLLVVLDRFFETRRMRYLLAAIVVLNISGIHPFNFIVTAMAGVVYVLYRLFTARQKGGVGKKLLAGIGIAIGLHAYILLPLLHAGSLGKEGLSSSLDSDSSYSNSLIYIANTRDVLTAFSFTRDVFKDFDFYTTHYRYLFFASVVLLYAYILYGVFVMREKLPRAHKRTLVFLSLSFVFLAILSTGTFLNVDYLLKFLVGLPGGWAFRSPLKWQLYMPFFLFAAIAALCVYAEKRFRKLTIAVLSVFLVGANGYLAVDVYRSLLTPRTIQVLVPLEQQMFRGALILAIRGDGCGNEIREHQDEYAEFTQLVYGKGAQRNDIREESIRTIRFRDYDFIFTCGTYASEFSEMEQIQIKDAGFQYYRNPEGAPRIFAFQNAYYTLNTSNIENVHGVAEGGLGRPGFIVDETLGGNTGATSIYPLFDAATIRSEKIILAEEQTELLVHSNYRAISYTATEDTLHIVSAYPQELILNGKLVEFEGVQNKETVLEYGMDPKHTYYLKIGSGYIPVQRNASEELGVVQGDMHVFAAEGNNGIPNGSFEDGVWAEDVGDCANVDDYPLISMRESDVASDGEYSLQLEAKHHIACAYTDVALDQGEYLLQFDYQSPQMIHAGVYVSQQAQTRVFIPKTDRWYTHHQKIDMASDESQVRVYLYGYPEIKGENAVIRYDNVRLHKVEKVKTIHVGKKDFIRMPLAQHRTHTFNITSTAVSTHNIIPNGTFSQGLWNVEVSDCYKYDAYPDIGISLQEGGSERGGVLQLRAKKHHACTSAPEQLVQEGGVYRLQFDYRSMTKGAAGYQVVFNTGEVVHKKQEVEDASWHTLTDLIRIPYGATSGKLYLYAYEPNGGGDEVVQYDNISLISLPDIENRYYVVNRQAGSDTHSSPHIDAVRRSPTAYTVNISNATTPFYIGAREKFNEHWRASVGGEDLGHGRLQFFFNAWYVDTGRLCRDRQMCQENPDGSYNFTLTIVHGTQRWLVAGYAISLMTVAGVVWYGASLRVRRKRR